MPRVGNELALNKMRLVYHLLRMCWRAPRRSGRVGAFISWLRHVARSVAVARRVADRVCGCGLARERLPARHRAAVDFRVLNGGLQLVTFLAIPVLTFAAPFVIMRNAVRGRRIERRRFEFVMMAALFAGFWSLMSGTVVVTAFTALSQLFA